MSEPAKAAAPHGSGERKQITAVFMDIAGFSNIASTADPEDLQHWLEDFYAQSRKIIEAHDGEVTEYLGDGIVALFGLERADELSASKAVNAAITAIRDVTAGKDKEFAIELRVGVATGEVAVRVNQSNDNRPRATGMVTILAQRIQEQATPGTVLISESTRHLLRDTITTHEIGLRLLKGFAEPKRLYQPLVDAYVSNPMEQAFFVGRTAELRRIATSEQPCLVVGQAGIGKSALARHISLQAPAATTFAADGVHIRASYQPFAQWIMQQTARRLPEFGDLERCFGALGDQEQRALALILGLEEGQRLLAEKPSVALKAYIEASLWHAIQSVQADGLLVFEDLHWLDNASFGVLQHLLQSAEAAKYKILMTSREDTKISKYLGHLNVTLIPLDVLDDTHAGMMLDRLSQGQTAANQRMALLTRAAGIPLFIEQLSKRGTTDEGPPATVPDSLMDLLAEQIDAMGPSKPVLQCAAIIGGSFDLEMLNAIAAEHAPLKPHLAKACTQNILQQTGPTTWAFSHALLHEAAYQGMLRQTRIAYHGKIAAHLQAHHADAVMRDPALLTDHLSLSQQHIPAIQSYLDVSQWALFQGAFDDSEAHVLAAISLCRQAPEGVDVRALEIACYTALGSVRMHTQGFTAQPVKDAFAHVARLTAGQNAFTAANGPAFYGSFTHAILAGDKAGSDHFSALLRAAAASVSAEETNSELRLASINVDTSLHFYTGNFDSQFKGFATLCDIYDIARHGAMISKYGVDPLAATQMFEAVGRAICGDTHLVADLSAASDAHQTRLNIPVMLPYAQIWGAVPLYYAGDTDVAIARCRKGLEIAHVQSATFWQVTGAAWLHVMDPTQSDSTEGLESFNQVNTALQTIGSNIGLPYFRAHYALALLKHEKGEEAYQVSSHAVFENQANGLHCWFPEVLRLHATVCLHTGRVDDAAHALEKAANLAAAQSAKLWLLRARLDQFRHGLTKASTIRATVESFDARAQPPEIFLAKELLAQA